MRTEVAMQAVTVKAKVRKDGSLWIPKAARGKLGLSEGDEVEIRLGRAERRDQVDPLLRIIGIGRGGRANGAQNHDKYLYGSDPT